MSPMYTDFIALGDRALNSKRKIDSGQLDLIVKCLQTPNFLHAVEV